MSEVKIPRRLFRCLPSALGILIAAVVPSVAFADVALTPVPLSQYSPSADVPVESSSFFVGPTGDTFGFENRLGTPTNGFVASCGVVRATATDAAEAILDHSLQESSTAPHYGTYCINLVPDSEGGMFVRGFFGPKFETPKEGFTVYFDSNLKRRWILYDRAFVGRQVNGQNLYFGAYQAPLSAMSYDPDSRRLLGFTLSSLDSHISRYPLFLSIAHTVDVTNGTILESGMQVGTGAPGVVWESEWSGTVGATSTFFTTKVGKNGSNASFYTYNGRKEWALITPLDSWNDRRLLNVVVRGEEIALLWQDVGIKLDANQVARELNEKGESSQQMLHVTVINRLGGEISSFSLPTMIRTAEWIDYQVTDVIEVVATDDYWIVIGSSRGSGPVALVAKLDGTFLGLAPLEDILSELPIQYVVSFGTVKNELRMIGIAEQGVVREYVVGIQDKPNYDPNRLPQRVKDQIDEYIGCGGCAQSKSGLDVSGLSLLFVFGLLFRRRFSRR